MMQVDSVTQEDQDKQKKIKLYTGRLCYTRKLIVMQGDSWYKIVMNKIKVEVYEVLTDVSQNLEGIENFIK